MIETIGAPFDLCGMRLGSRLGPDALRLAGLEEAIARLGIEVADAGDVPAGKEATAPGGLRNLPPLLACVRALRTTTARILEAGRRPLLMGGEHTLALGSIGAALGHLGDDLAVLWIDAHADINTVATSATGNVHGMPLAVLSGAESGVDGVRDQEWRALLDTTGPTRLRPERISWFGLRDVDPGEVGAMRGLALTMHDVDRHGVERLVTRWHEWACATGARHLWISFDVDVLDPALAPGTGTAVRGGLTYREAHLLAELLSERLRAEDCPYRLVGLDVVETNPLVDTHNETARMAVEWVASLFGKRILGSEPLHGL